jgi:hypothetical protein
MGGRRFALRSRTNEAARTNEGTRTNEGARTDEAAQDLAFRARPSSITAPRRLWTEHSVHVMIGRNRGCRQQWRLAGRRA